MKVAVSGASGFIGRHVVRALHAAGVQVTALTRRPLDAELAACCSEQVGVDLVTDRPTHAAIGAPDVLLHLAWGELHDFRSEVHVRIQLPAHYEFLRALITSGLPRLVVTGTCLEYGLRYGPLGEDLPTDPILAYPQAKDALRRQLELLRRVRPFRFAWLRLFYVYGPGQRANALIPSLDRAISAGAEEFEMSLGEQLRDYQPVEDLAADIALVARSAAAEGIYNVCSGQPISVRRLAEEHLARCGAALRLRLAQKPYPDYEPLAFWGRRDRLDALWAASGGPHRSPLRG